MIFEGLGKDPEAAKKLISTLYKSGLLEQECLRNNQNIGFCFILKNGTKIQWNSITDEEGNKVK